MLAAAAQILAVRVWPADDYTRVTLENDAVLKATHFIVKDPERRWSTSKGWSSIPPQSLVRQDPVQRPVYQQVRRARTGPTWCGWFST